MKIMFDFDRQRRWPNLKGVPGESGRHAGLAPQRAAGAECGLFWRTETRSPFRTTCFASSGYLKHGKKPTTSSDRAIAASPK
ncbi:unnamed protein product [Ixodes persulcatus]